MAIRLTVGSAVRLRRCIWILTVGLSTIGLRIRLTVRLTLGRTIWILSIRLSLRGTIGLALRCAVRILTVGLSLRNTIRLALWSTIRCRWQSLWDLARQRRTDDRRNRHWLARTTWWSSSHRAVVRSGNQRIRRDYGESFAGLLQGRGAGLTIPYEDQSLEGLRNLTTNHEPLRNRITDHFRAAELSHGRPELDAIISNCEAISSGIRTACLRVKAAVRNIKFFRLLSFRGPRGRPDGDYREHQGAHCE